ncbi:MAG TPA: acyltransferase [Thermoleophilaceae bacterium]|nr:acyltransferase [Thermoleophilaceae bacterium]
MTPFERARSLALIGRAEFPLGRIALVRVPRISRPAKHTRLVLGPGVRLFENVAFFLDGDGATIEIGRDTYLNRRVEVMCKDRVTIGEHCAIAWDVSIMDTNYHWLSGGAPDAPVEIGDRVWIGARATLLPGVTIGDGAVVAAGSVVNRDVPEGTLVAGVPAEPIRRVEWSPSPPHGGRFRRRSRSGVRGRTL